MTESYVGLTEGDFKTRYRNHKASFSNASKRSNTELSKHIWSLKDSYTPVTVKRKILNKTSAYTNASKRRQLCISEKYQILVKLELFTLNRRNENVTTCRHSGKYLVNK